MALKKEIKETEDTTEVEMQGIEVGSPLDIRPKSLPLVVKLPEDASPAQIAYAKTLNSYAYSNPEKWEIKKDALIAKLLSLKNAPDPITDSNLKVNKTAF